MRRITRRLLVPLFLLLAIISYSEVNANNSKGSAKSADKNPKIVEETDFYRRIMAILRSPKLDNPDQPVVQEQKLVHDVTSLGLVHDVTIFGKAEATRTQCVEFLRRNNPFPKINSSIEELVDMYFEEAEAEGIRPDVALSQAILETGYFRYGGDVLPEQNNYAGIGTTGNGVKGIYFPSPRIGIRAHIQHLMVYTSTRMPATPIVNPRYDLVKSMPDRHAQSATWISLSGKWAVPGIQYGHNILKIHDSIKNTIHASSRGIDEHNLHK